MTHITWLCYTALSSLTQPTVMFKITQPATLIMVVSLLLNGCDQSAQMQQQLPWKIDILSDGSTEVMGLKPGSQTLKQLAQQLKHIPDLAIFKAAHQPANLEAYFGKVRIGVFNYRLIAELSVEQDELAQAAENSTKKARTATPSNMLRIDLKGARQEPFYAHTVWKLALLPSADYTAKQWAYFGPAGSTQSLNKHLQYWHFPSKGLIILHNTEGPDILYYSHPKDFAKLKASLPNKVNELFNTPSDATKQQGGS